MIFTKRLPRKLKKKGKKDLACRVGEIEYSHEYIKRINKLGYKIHLGNPNVEHAISVILDRHSRIRNEG